MTEGNLIHVKFEHSEMLEAKKDILHSEIFLLKTIQKMKAYRTLRKKELRTKSGFLRKLREIKTIINKIQKTFPQTQAKNPKQAPAKIQPKKVEYDPGIENELRNIQKKLNALQQ